MNSYRITNSFSGLTLGVYAADDVDGALDALARDAGYRDYEHAYRVAQIDEWELVVEKVDGLIDTANTKGER